MKDRFEVFGVSLVFNSRAPGVYMPTTNKRVIIRCIRMKKLGEKKKKHRYRRRSGTIPTTPSLDRVPFVVNNNKPATDIPSFKREIRYRPSPASPPPGAAFGFPTRARSHQPCPATNIMQIPLLAISLRIYIILHLRVIRF